MGHPSVHLRHSKRAGGTHGVPALSCHAGISACTAGSIVTPPRCARSAPDRGPQGGGPSHHLGGQLLPPVVAGYSRVWRRSSARLSRCRHSHGHGRRTWWIWETDRCTDLAIRYSAGVADAAGKGFVRRRGWCLVRKAQPCSGAAHAVHSRRYGPATAELKPATCTACPAGVAELAALVCRQRLR